MMDFNASDISFKVTKTITRRFSCSKKNLRRTKGYYERNKKMFKMADLQRVNTGIAMCHFDLACHELDLTGKWAVKGPEIGSLPELTSYLVSWVEKCQP